MHKNMGQKVVISSEFGYFSNTLTLSSIMCVGKRRGGFKILSWYFSNKVVIYTTTLHATQENTLGCTTTGNQLWCTQAKNSTLNTPLRCTQ